MNIQHHQTNIVNVLDDVLMVNYVHGVAIYINLIRKMKKIRKQNKLKKFRNLFWQRKMFKLIFFIRLMMIFCFILELLTIKFNLVLLPFLFLLLSETYFFSLIHLTSDILSFDDLFIFMYSVFANIFLPPHSSPCSLCR